MTLEACSSWNFNDQYNFFSATNDIHPCWEMWPEWTSNLEDIVPEDEYNPAFALQSTEYPPWLGIDLHACSKNLISLPEDVITQFSRMHFPDVGNTLFYESEIVSCITEPAYQHDRLVLNPQSPDLMNFYMGFKEEGGVVSLPSSSQILLPCQVQDEAERKRIIVESHLKAFAEALENEAWDLLKVIVNRLRRMVSPVGSRVERVAHYLLESLSMQEGSDGAISISGAKMKELCSQNSFKAFQALCELYPYARFAHFTANQSIVESLSPNRPRKLHIVDFDVMEGLQWPPLMAALADEIFDLLRITAIKWDADHDDIGFSDGKTDARLSDSANFYKIPFFFEEIPLQDLRQHMTLCATEGAYEDTTVAFNMMVALPHMMCHRSRLHVMEFLSVARGMRATILTVAHAGVEREHKDFVAHLQKTVEYYSAMLESMEAGLPDHVLVRSVMEHLFVAPKIQKTFSTRRRNDEEINVGELAGKCGFGGGGVGISEENLRQAREVVSLSAASPFYRVAETSKNEVTLKWRDAVLLSVSTWK